MRRFKKLDSDKAAGDWLRFEEINFFIEDAKYILEALGRPCIPDDSRMVWLEYKDDDEITVKKGDFIIGGKIYTASSDITWDFSGSNTDSLGIGSDSIEANTWYYLYAVQNNGTVKIGASQAAPKSLFRNSYTSGSTIYTEATYLGAFFNGNSLSGKILPFYHCGGNFYYAKGLSSVTNDGAITEDGSGGTSYQEKTLRVPETAVFCDGIGTYHLDSGASGAYGYISPVSADNYYYELYQIAGKQANLDNAHQLCRIPLFIAQTVYMRDSDSNTNNEIDLYEIGFVDKFLR